MQLKYHDDIKWQDLPRIERPTLERSRVKTELSNPRPRLRQGSIRVPMSKPYHRDINPYVLQALLKKIEQGSVLLV